MTPEESIAWDIVKARDRALVEIRKLYDQLVAKSMESQKGSEAYINEVEDDRAARLQALASMQQQISEHGLARHAAESRVAELEQALQGTKDYLMVVEADRAARLQALESMQQQLGEHGRARDVAGRRVMELEAYLAATRAAANSGLLAAAPWIRHSRHIVVARYHERLLPFIMQASAAGAGVTVFGCPKEFKAFSHPAMLFHDGSLWEWLASIPSSFNSKAYLQAHPDIAAAIDQGVLASGWEHFQLFGQWEGRDPGGTCRAGLGDFDTIFFDATHAASVRDCLAGRLQTGQRMLVSGPALDSGVLPEGTAVHPLPNACFVLHPPSTWLGRPAVRLNRSREDNWPQLQRSDLYPERHPTGAPWPRITVVTVSYNQGHYLQDTLHSVLSQNYPNLEYIVVDGGSTDDSRAIIERHADRLAWWVSEKDRGQSHALNKGFAHATGDILTWLNSDDQLTPESLFVVADAHLRHRPDMIAGRCARLMEPAIVPYHLHRCALPLGECQPLPLDRLLDLDNCWLRGDFFHQPEVFFTRDIFLRSGGLVREDLYFSMDYDLWVRMARAGAVILPIPEVLAIFRQHPAQKTGGDELPFLPELRDVNSHHRAGLDAVTQLSLS